jgi:uncharacterized protein (DUF58 family)
MDGIIQVRLRRRLPFVWLILLILVAVLLPHRIWNTILIGFGGLIAIAYFWARHLSQGLSGSRKLRFGWMAVGDRLSERFEIVNNSTLPALWVEIVDDSNVPGYQASVVRSVGSHDAINWKQSAVCQQRGQFKLGPWSLHTGDPFGLFKITVSYGIANEIIIHPPIYTQLPIPLPAGQGEGQIRARQRRWRATTNAAGIRGYQPGDPYKWIHWPKSARHNNLLVRQFDLDSAGDIWLLLDMDQSVQVGDGPKGTEEQSILLATSLAVRSLNENRGIGLASYGRNPELIPPSLGQGQQWRLLRTLALLKANGQEDLSQALQDLSQIAQRGSAAVIITPNNEAGWLPKLLQLNQRGISCSVVLLDHASYQAAQPNPPPPQPLRAENLGQVIRRLGLNCSIIKEGEIGQIAQAQERHGFWEFKVTPTGKVVTIRNPLEEAHG